MCVFAYMSVCMNVHLHPVYVSHETENSSNNLVFYAQSTIETEKERGQERTVPKHVSPVRKTKTKTRKMDKQLTAVLHCNTALGILRSSLCNS